MSLSSTNRENGCPILPNRNLLRALQVRSVVCRIRELFSEAPEVADENIDPHREETEQDLERESLLFETRLLIATLPDEFAKCLVADYILSNLVIQFATGTTKYRQLIVLMLKNLHSGIDIEKYRSPHVSLLHLFCQGSSDDEEIFLALMSFDCASLATVDAHGNTPLHVFLRRSRLNLSLFRILLDRYPRASTIPNLNGELPLHIAFDIGCDFRDLQDAPRLEIIREVTTAFPQVSLSQIFPYSFPYFLILPCVLSSALHTQTSPSRYHTLSSSIAYSLPHVGCHLTGLSRLHSNRSRRWCGGEKSNCLVAVSSISRSGLN